MPFWIKNKELGFTEWFKSLFFIAVKTSLDNFNWIYKLNKVQTVILSETKVVEKKEFHVRPYRRVLHMFGKLFKLWKRKL